MLTCPTVLQEDKKKKNPVYKNQGGEPIHQKYKANEGTRRHNPKKKQIKRDFTNPINIKWIIVLYVGNILLAVLSLVNFVM
jgi:hypothetical protein